MLLEFCNIRYHNNVESTMDVVWMRSDQLNHLNSTNESKVRIHTCTCIITCYQILILVFAAFK